MSEHDDSDEPTRDVVIAYDFEDRSRHGQRATVPLSEARAMVRDGRASYADEPRPEQPDWYRRANDVRATTPPAPPEPPQDDKPDEAGPVPETPVAEVPQDPPPHRTRGAKKE